MNSVKNEKGNLIDGVVKNSDLYFDPTKVNSKFRQTMCSASQDLEAIEQQNGLLLFSTNGKLNSNNISKNAVEASMNPDVMNNSESILSKFIEFKSNVTPNDLI